MEKALIIVSASCAAHSRSLCDKNKLIQHDNANVYAGKYPLLAETMINAGGKKGTKVHRERVMRRLQIGFMVTGN